MDSVINFLWVIKEIYFYMIIAYILMSWLPNARDSFIGIALGKCVDPYLAPFRKIIPPIGGMIDISPIVAIIALNFVFMGIEALLTMFS